MRLDGVNPSAIPHVIAKRAAPCRISMCTV
jgi:hypothetical protein